MTKHDTVNLIDTSLIKRLVTEELSGNRGLGRDFGFVCNFSGLSGQLSNYPNDAIKVKDLLEIMGIIHDEWLKAK